jgi:hypothetical protein
MRRELHTSALGSGSSFVGDDERLAAHARIEAKTR